MPDLEQLISEWRAKMLAAGIQSPAPLDELESHLREEIDRQVKSGLGDAAAFQTAVQNIGQAQVLEREFKKVGGGRKIIRATLLVIGWLAFSLMLFGSVVSLDLDWNFFNWSPHFSIQAIIDLSTLAAALTAIFFLARVTRGRVARIVSLLVCVAMFSFALANSAPEPRTSGWFGRSRPSPVWFRGGIVMVFAMPGVFWLRSLKRRSIFQNTPGTKKRVIPSA